MTEQDLLRECVRRLNTCGVPYMLTGSMASNAWGIPRSTHDLDFVIQLPPSAVPALVDAFTGDYFIDEPYLRHWAAELGVLETLESALGGNPPPKTT